MVFLVTVKQRHMHMGDLLEGDAVLLEHMTNENNQGSAESKITANLVMNSRSLTVWYLKGLELQLVPRECRACTVLVLGRF
ncbi:hypothetical protein DPEC_G00024210 [Dallia pectoralis]|uniref:Uncharacterized protein n=1 Tax=Dallia pectoralis TaxID=75939 RepID=A0ACC2HGV1_DALPE|nr:hypothetical protein DPEC_G00024210 [Dallia pectoralis]